MKHLILLRHSVRIDKDIPPSEIKKLDTSSWLLNYDPPLNLEESLKQIEHLELPITKNHNQIVIHSSPYNRCVQTLDLLLQKLPEEPVLKIDQALSEWLNFNFNLNFLPPNDNGISLLNNINQYIYQTGSHLQRDMAWDSYKFGKPGEYGEEYDFFKKRCLNFLNQLLKYYENSDKTVIIISHGAVISILLQIILGKPFFKEIPLCEPVILDKLNQNLFQLHSNIEFVAKFNNQIYKLKDLKMPVEYETNMFIDNDGDSEYSDSSSDDEEEGITFKVRSRSNTTGSIHPKLRLSKLSVSASEKNFNDLKKNFFIEPDEEETKVLKDSSSDEDILLNFSSSNGVAGHAIIPSKENNDDSKKNLQKLLFNDESDKKLYKIDEEDDYWFGFNR